MAHAKSTKSTAAQRNQRLRSEKKRTVKNRDKSGIVPIQNTHARKTTRDTKSAKKEKNATVPKPRSNRQRSRGAGRERDHPGRFRRKGARPNRLSLHSPRASPAYQAAFQDASTRTSPRAGFASRTEPGSR